MDRCEAGKPRRKRKDLRRGRTAHLLVEREITFRAHAVRDVENTTIRDVAAAANIDAAMVIRYFGGKDALFAEASDFDLALPDLSDVPREAVGQTLARHFVRIWESDAGFEVLLRSATTNAAAAERIRAIFAAQVSTALARATGDMPDAPIRAALSTSKLLGLALSRYVLRLGPVAAIGSDEIVRRIGPVIQQILTEGRPAE